MRELTCGEKGQVAMIACLSSPTQSCCHASAERQFLPVVHVCTARVERDSCTRLQLKPVKHAGATAARRCCNAGVVVSEPLE